MDNDGDRDLVVSLHRDRTVRILTNVNGVFSVGTTINVGATVRPDGVALADFNNDGRLDIATTLGNNGVDFVGVIRNLVTGFSAVASYPSMGANPGPIVAFDTDNDGDADLAALNQDAGTVVVLPNNGAGVFGAGSLLTTGAGPDSLVAANLTGGPTVDLLVSNRDSASLSLFANQVTPAGCDSIDFNGNGAFPEDQDVIDFFTVLAGGACSTPICGDIDFNNNDAYPEDQDVIDFFTVLAGGACSTQ
ncbi:MAG: FG-GAP repeat domain-containing protein [Phycisphaerales bacterium]